MIPSILYNAEAFPSYTSKEIEELEKIQHKILTGILEVPISTPYCVLLMETGWWTMEARLAYRKLLLYQNILKSDDKRVVKKILEVQENNQRQTTWLSNVKKLMKKYSITLKPKESLKSSWKKHIKEKITQRSEEEIRELCKGKKKGRTVKNDKYERKKYLGTVSLNEAKKIIRARTHMNKLPGNYRGKTEGICQLCEKEKGDTEHYFSCKRVSYLTQLWEVKKDDLKSTDIQKLKAIGSFMEKVEIMLEPLNQ